MIALETVMWGAWALLLGRCAKSTDVVFGAAVAGRPVALEGSHAMLGPFANTIPLRVRLPAEEPVQSWLAHMQAQREELQQYEHAASGQIREWSELAETPLFETCVAVQEPPFSAPASLRGEGTALTLERSAPSKPGSSLDVRIIPDGEEVRA